MIYCKDCEFWYVGGNCSRVLFTNPYTDDCEPRSLRTKDPNNNGECPYFKKKRGFWAKLFGK